MKNTHSCRPRANTRLSWSRPIIQNAFHCEKRKYVYHMCLNRHVWVFWRDCIRTRPSRYTRNVMRHGFSNPIKVYHNFSNEISALCVQRDRMWVKTFSFQLSFINVFLPLKFSLDLVEQTSLELKLEVVLLCIWHWSAKSPGLNPPSWPLRWSVFETASERYW